ncbi:MAG: radical SAM protein, partial [Oscillospiraceae bacterium]|nr:radical SAM protein [Oscillospiraceae bacterium]
MANIMVTEACNLRCPYCFAEEFVNHSPKEMSVEDFRIALNFALSDPDDKQVGIIGGEPLLYSHIEE